ncbi:MAG TPA: rod shape-determining protein, partial [Firmicutes bacterium]|nr:rod shape-determining protein [Bacillota bacterium]
EEPIHSIVDAIRGVLEVTPPELAADIMNKGMSLTGGGALLDGMARLIQERTGVPVTLAEDPLSCVVRGTGQILDSIESMSRTPFVASYTKGR